MTLSCVEGCNFPRQCKMLAGIGTQVHQVKESKFLIFSSACSNIFSGTAAAFEPYPTERCRTLCTILSLAFLSLYSIYVEIRRECFFRSDKVTLRYSKGSH